MLTLFVHGAVQTPDRVWFCELVEVAIDKSYVVSSALSFFQVLHARC